MNPPTRKQRNKRTNNNGRTRPQRNRSQQQTRGNDLIEERRMTNVRSNILRVTRTGFIPSFNFIPFSGILASGSYDFTLTFSLLQTNFYVAGLLVSSTANPGASDLTAMFDEYRIMMVEVSIFYSHNTNFDQGGTPNSLPILYQAFDPDDSAAVSKIGILQYDNVRIIQTGSFTNTAGGYITKMKPTPLKLVYNSLLTSAFAPDRTDPWLSTDSATSCEHFGVKTYIDPMNTSLNVVTGSFTALVKYHFELRTPR